MDKLMKIGILSGKGGVGKTSISASLGILARDEFHVALVDCDVDAPNLSILFPPLNGKKLNYHEITGTLKANFIPNLCSHCKSCIEDRFCEFDALSWNEISNIPEINYLACEGCGACKVLCPEDVFNIGAVKSGEIFYYKTKFNLPLVYGKTILGSTTSGKLVSDVKEHIKKLEIYDDLDLVIIDGPPGIGCPVIATITGLDYIITVTEPTPSGLHDLKRLIEVINSFEIPFGVVINKADLKSDFERKFQYFIDETNYHILGKISYSEDIPIAMSHAEPLITNSPQSKVSEEISLVFKNLKKQLEIWKP